MGCHIIYLVSYSRIAIRIFFSSVVHSLVCFCSCVLALTQSELQCAVFATLFVRVQEMRSSEKPFWQQRFVHVFARHKSMLSAHCTFSKNGKLKRARGKFRFRANTLATHTHTQMHTKCTHTSRKYKRIQLEMNGRCNEHVFKDAVFV